MDASSLLGAGDLAQIRQLRRDGLATSFALQNPPVFITIRRWDEEAGTMVDVPGEYRVAIQYATTEPGNSGGQSTQSTMREGTLRGFAPLPLKLGDRFPLPGGSMAVVSAPEPSEQDGIVTAAWELQEGAV